MLDGKRMHRVQRVEIDAREANKVTLTMFARVKVKALVDKEGLTVLEGPEPEGPRPRCPYCQAPRGSAKPGEACCEPAAE
jgi:hypothetical protein